MGRKHKKCNPFAQRKRDLKLGLKARPDKRSEPYQDIVRENDLFVKYYEEQNICPAAEFPAFLEAIRTDLPTTFRITAYRGEAETLLNIIKGQCFNDYLKGAAELKNEAGEDRVIGAPFSLPWYPNENAWQMELTRKDIRRSEAFYKLHNFLIAETSAGSISRQEAVSMIPPLVLDVQPHHKVLDMCAAPGSKTAQLIEYLHAGSETAIPTGYVVANDLDNNRCYMLVHQAKRLNSPCFIVTNHDSSILPNFNVTNPETQQRQELRFDRVLCDVPCSGDGTLRKNPDIWQKWNQGQSSNLHGIQYRIAKRGAEMLAVGGRLVYSTCSLNPIENEAVLHRLLRDAEGALEIVDAASYVNGLKFYPGMTKWRPASKNIEFFECFEDVPEKYHTVIRPQMFPPSAEDAPKYNLEKCLRILPHLQNTGGFFVAALRKIRLLPWEKDPSKKAAAATSAEEPKPEATDEEQTPETETTDDQNPKRQRLDATTTNGRSETTDDKRASAPWGPQRKKGRLHGYKEDPYVFFKEDEKVWRTLKAFYNLSDSFNPLCLLTRSISDKKKNIYFCSEAVRDLLQLNEESIKIINTGVKTFVRCDNRNMKCSYRLANEGLPSIDYMIGQCRRLDICKDDLIVLLQNTDPTKPPLLTELTEATREAVQKLGAGSCVLKCIDGDLTITLVGWRGTSSLRAYTDTNDTVHMLRLLGADLSKYDVNKFAKKLEAENAAAAIKADQEDTADGDDVKMSIVQDVTVKVEDVTVKVENVTAKVENVTVKAE